MVYNYLKTKIKSLLWSYGKQFRTYVEKALRQKNV